ncbi:ribulose-phosphate 3-epimerase [Boudabousia tangfeifanii]|uniref:Ribulose-phosphate 3-epimerase n=1 Tax=Boudabousia tangfeifanii TaxID=1912795 RepID=A0A1D9MKD8_9ACTO|nr:ribulose-phosphate 3-epimerase [Boudabousia tangfeifanii]AOZ72630.1 ribulose-phosphate 3-epimerase [Boudabousia tangfeifanii]
MMSTISPSILNADAANLGAALVAVSNADFAHVDVMDNHFVPNLTWGLPVVEALVNRNVLPLDAHLMIEDPDRWAPAYAEVGCASVTFHHEACRDPKKLVKEIHRHGALAAAALKPGTDPKVLKPYLSELDMVLVMTVEPGFGGQAFMPQMLPKVQEIRQWLKAENLEIRIQVDGGISRANLAQAAEAGADVFVAGSAIFRANNPASEVEVLRGIAQEHVCH